MSNVSARQRVRVDSPRVNVARRLSETAGRYPNATAVVVPRDRHAGQRQYDTYTFAQLEDDTNRLASGLRAYGVEPGMRIVLLVRPGMEFISLVFALFKAGAVIVLVDPGMGRRNLVQCLAEVEPDGFVAIPLGQAVRSAFRSRFPKSRLNVTVGRRWWWGGTTLRAVRHMGRRDPICHETRADDPAAIIFTSGGTGPPKGVLYCHGNFDRQVTEIRDRYAIAPGEVDLAAFPLFGLFNCAMGVTTVVPDMDASRPAKVDPRNIVEAVKDWNVTQSFGSPAIWNRVGQYCQSNGVKLPTLRRVLSAGAPVPPHVLSRMKDCIADDGEVHTPYGATESLPVATISATEVLTETCEAWAQGGGTCVGSRFEGIDWKVIRISDEPIASLQDAVELPVGEIGELIVSGPVVTSQYVTRTEWNALSKIADGKQFWHRMGDVGYLDAEDRFWFCGRKGHRVTTADGPMYTVRCEAVFNQHPHVYRSALVGVGPADNKRPVIVVECWPERRPRGDAQRRRLIAELQQRAAANVLTASIGDFLVHPAMPVDVRHNAKIHRERLAEWAAGKVGQG